MYNFVSSPNHIFVSCQHTAIKFSKRYWFLGSFSSGFDKFSPTGLFQKSTKPFKGGWPCIDGFGYYFRVPWGCMKQWSVWWRFCALQKWQKRFVCSTKNFYYKCHRSRYFEYIKNFSCETMCLFEQRFWLAVLMRTTEETAITSFTYDEIRETSKTRLVHRRYLHVVLHHTNSNMYYKYMVVVGRGGRASLFPPAPTMQMSINFSRLWGAMS